MPTTTLKPNTVDQNYANGANYVGGVAPAAGYTVNLPNQASQGSVTATNLAITNEQINLSGNATFTATGTTSLDSASSLVGATSNGNSAFLNDGFVNNGTITDLTLNVGGSFTPTVTNNGTIAFNAPLSATNGGNYEIASGNLANFVNNGSISIVSILGASNTSPASGPMAPIPTSVEFGTAVSGTGTIQITGGSPGTTTAVPFMTNGGQQQAFAQFDFGANVTGNTFNLNDGYATFGSVVSGSTFNFQDASGVVRFTNTFTGVTITGFRAGDILDVGTAVNSAGLSYNATTDVLSYTDTSGMAHSITIRPTGTQAAFTTASFVVDNNGTNGLNEPSIVTTAAAPCYCPGTLIRTDRGDVAVEDLAIGDRVVTLDGSAEPIRWLGRRAFDGRFIAGRRDVLPVRIHAGALGEDLPRRDLWVSPLHAMYLQGGLVPAGDLVNGVSVTQADAVDRVEYIHIELDRHHVIWAEDAASESFVDDNSRAMFHNAHEFDALYPDALRRAAVYCAPRIVDGEALEAVKREVDSLAGLFVPGMDGSLRGNIDGIQGNALRGWAQDSSRPDVPVCLDVTVDGRVVARTVANQFRADLRAAGLGSGCHGFWADLPPAACRGAVTVRRAADGAVVATLARRVSLAA